jgi:hypothetical protein
LIKKFKIHPDVKIDEFNVVGDGPKDGFARIDVRLTFKTVDGALIYVQFLGLAKRVYRVANS